MWANIDLTNIWPLNYKLKVFDAKLKDFDCQFFNDFLSSNVKTKKLIIIAVNSIITEYD